MQQDSIDLITQKDYERIVEIIVSKYGNGAQFKFGEHIKVDDDFSIDLSTKKNVKEKPYVMHQVLVNVDGICTQEWFAKFNEGDYTLTVRVPRATNHIGRLDLVGNFTGRRIVPPLQMYV